MERSGCFHCAGASSTRRDFLRVGTLSFLGIGLSDFLRLSHTLAGERDAQAKAQAVILVWLEGGISHLIVGM